MGTDFQFYKMSSIKEMDGDDSCTVLWMHSITLNSTLIKMVNFMSCVFYQKKKIFGKKKSCQSHQNLWDAVNATLGGKFITQIIYIRKEERFQLNHFSFYLKKLAR